MDRRLRGLSTIIGAVLGATCVVALVGGCGGPQGSLDQLSVTQYRYNVDESGSIVRVLGVVRNTGEERTPAAEVVVTLVGRTGSMKGQNRTDLPSLEGGGQHRFALGVTTHGRVDEVDITIVPRGAELEGEAGAESDDAAPENAAAGNTSAQEGD